MKKKKKSTRTASQTHSHYKLCWKHQAKSQLIEWKWVCVREEEEWEGVAQSYERAKQIKTSTNGIINNNKHSYIVELLFMLHAHVRWKCEHIQWTMWNEYENNLRPRSNRWFQASKRQNNNNNNSQIQTGFHLASLTLRYVYCVHEPNVKC